MARFLVTAYLLTATALGPFLCCCTVGEWTSARSRCCSRRATNEHAPPHRPHANHHCHSHATGRPSTKTPDKPAPVEPDRCPCERHCGSQVAVVEKSTFETEQSAAGVPAPADAVVSLDATFIEQFGGLAMEQHALDSPLFNSRAVLRALHVLRC